MRNKRLFLAVVILLIFALVSALWLIRPQNDLFLTSHIALSTDEDGEFASRELEEVFSSKSTPSPAYKLEFDLSDFSGKLVKLDLSGQIVLNKSRQSHSGLIAYSARLVAPQGYRQIEFTGWRKNPDSPIYTGALGSPSTGFLEEDDNLFFYDLDNSVWRVFRVPPQAALQLLVSPRPGLDPAGAQRYSARAPLTLPSRGFTANAEIRPPDVFIYLVDTLRADHLSCYGYSRQTSPHLDAFAAQATLFEDTHTPATWTRPACASVFTGLYPAVHGVNKGGATKIGDWSLLLPEALKHADYATCVVSTNSHVTDTFGFDQGLDTFDFVNRASPDWVNQQAARFLSDKDPAQPVFVYLHTVEPHDPYTPKPETLRRFDRGFPDTLKGNVRPLRWFYHPELTPDEIEHLIDRYDAEIYENDQGFADFLALLRRTGRYENSLIIFVSDHGESFLEHGVIRHGRSLNSQEMHVPLVIRFPQGKFAGRRISDHTSLIDIYPTVLAQVGGNIHPSYPLTGINLASLAEHQDNRITRPAYAKLSQDWVNFACVIDEDGYKRVINLSTPSENKIAPEAFGLWDTNSDYPEQVNLLDQLPVRAAYSEQLIARWFNQLKSRRGFGAHKPDAFEVPEERLEELRALGYLE